MRLQRVPDISPRVMKWRKLSAPPMRLAPSRQVALERQKRIQVEALALWWHGVRESGALVNSDAREGVDYIGVKPWPELVSQKYLYSSYLLWVNNDALSLHEFLNESRTIIHIKRHGERVATVPRGKKMARYKVVYYKVSKTPLFPLEA